MSARAVKLILATERLQDAFAFGLAYTSAVRCHARAHVSVQRSSHLPGTGRITELRSLEVKEPVFEGSMVVKVFSKPHSFPQDFHAVQVCTGKVSNKCCYMYVGTYFFKPSMDIFACMSITLALVYNLANEQLNRFSFLDRGLLGYQCWRYLEVMFFEHTFQSLYPVGNCQVGPTNLIECSV